LWKLLEKLPIGKSLWKVLEKFSKLVEVA